MMISLKVIIQLSLAYVVIVASTIHIKLAFIFKMSSNEVPFLQNQSYTRSKVTQVVHTWTIDHFSYHCDADLNGHDYLESSRFSLTKFDQQVKFFVRLYPRGEFDDEEEENQVSLYVHLESAKVDRINVQVKLSIINEVGMKNNFKEERNELTRDKPLGWTDYITHEDILDEENRFLPGDKLTLCCEVAVMDECTILSTDQCRLVEMPSVYRWDTLCNRTKVSSGSSLAVMRSWTDTELKVDKFAHMWTIDNFSFQPNNDQNAVIESTKFFSPKNEEFKFYLDLYPAGADEESENHVSVFLNLKPCEMKVRALYEISILDAIGTKHCVVEGRKKFSQDDTTWGWPTFVERIDLFDVAKGFLIEDRLTIYCEISLLTDLIEKSSSHDKREQDLLNRKAETQTLQDLRNLLDSGKFTDVVFVLGNKELSAHKSILAARSPVFAAMFEHEMEEKRLNRVIITDVPAEIFQELLRFIYCGQIEHTVLDRLDDQLLVAADKNICEVSLYSKISSINVGQLLILADMHSANGLKATAFEFINSQTGLVTQNGVLKAVLHYKPELFYEIFCSINCDLPYLQFA